MTWSAWLLVAAVNGLLSVVAGAFGAHSLRDRVTPRRLEIFETGARYQMYHALALLAVAWLASRAPAPPLTACGWCFLAGIILFSGSLYAITLTGVDALGAITPFGGLLFIAGWGLLAWSALRVGPGL